MTCLRDRLLTVLVLTVLHAASVSAQPAGVSQPWTMSLGLGSAYDSNANFAPGSGAGIGHVGGSVQAGLGRSWSRPRGDMSLNAGVTRPMFQLAGLNGLQYGVTVGTSYAFTQRLRWSLADSVASSYAEDAKGVVDVSLRAPKVVTRTNSISTQFGYALSPRTDIQASVSESGVAFASPAFHGGVGVGASVSLSRRLNRTQSLGASYQYQHQSSSGGVPGSAAQGILASWQGAMGRRIGVTVKGGLRPYTLPGESGYRFDPALTVGMAVQIRPGHSLGLNYDRIVEQAGDRTHLVQTLSGAYAVSLGSRVGVDVGGSYSRGTYPLNKILILSGRQLQTSISYHIVSKLSLSLSSSVSVHHLAPDPPTSSFRAGLGVTYGTTW